MMKLGWLIGLAAIVAVSGVTLSAPATAEGCFMGTTAQSTPPVVVMTTPPAKPADAEKKG